MVLDAGDNIRKKRKQNRLLPEQKLYVALTESVKLKMGEQAKDDEDRHFLLSLVSELRDVLLQHKLEVRTEF
jgi:hypothetical protein